MNRNRKITAVLIAFLMSFTAIQAGPKDPEKRLQRMKEHLELTDSQYQQIKEIAASYSSKRDALKKKMIPLHEKLANQMTAENPDRSTVKSTMESLAELRIEMRLLMLDQRLEMQKLMNDEQKKKWFKHMQMRREKMKKEWQKGKPDRD